MFRIVTIKVANLISLFSITFPAEVLLDGAMWERRHACVENDLCVEATVGLEHLDDALTQQKYHELSGP